MPGHQELCEGLPALGESHCFGTEKIISSKNMLELSQRRAGCLCSAKRTLRKTLFCRKETAHWPGTGRGHRPCPQLSHRSGGTCGGFSSAACPSPSDAARCSKAPVCLGRPPAPGKLSHGGHQPAQSQRNQPNLPSAQRVPLPSPAPGTALHLCKPSRGTWAPPNQPTPDAETLRRRVAGTEKYLSLSVPGLSPIDGSGVSRLGKGPGNSVPAGSPGGTGVPRQHHTGSLGTSCLQQPRAWRRVVPGKRSVDFAAHGREAGTV